MYCSAVPPFWHHSLMHTFEGHEGAIRSVAIGGDNSLIVTGSKDHTAKIWDSETGRCFRTFTGHTKPITSIDISENKKFIITADDKTAKIWDRAADKCIHSIGDGVEKIKSISIQNDEFIITSSSDKTARMYKIALIESIPDIKYD